MKRHKIAVIPGDGIGKEVIPEGLRVVESAARLYGIDIEFRHFDWSCVEYYQEHGQILPDN